MKKPFTIELRFDSKAEAESWIAGWLDGGGEQTMGWETIYEESDKWDKHTARWLKLKEYKEEIDASECDTF